MIECIYQHFRSEYKLSEDTASRLESYLRGVESLKINLDKVRAVNAEEAAAQEARIKQSKRERSPAPDDMADAAGTPGKSLH